MSIITNQSEPKIIEQLLPLKYLVVVLQFTAQTKLHFFHQAPITAFLRNLSNHNPLYEQLICIDAIESNRLSYQEGDYYRFTLFGLKGCDELLQTLIEQLQQLPLSFKALKNPDKALPFKDNVKLISIQDGFSQQPITHTSQLCQYGMELLQQECQLWRQVLEKNDSLSLRWISPVRFLKSKAQRQEKEHAKGEQRYCHNSHDLEPDLLLNRLYDSLSALAQRKQSKKKDYSRAAPPQGRFTENHCYWVDNEYLSANKKKNPLGGMLGLQSIVFNQSLPENWLCLLVLGQYTGIGQRRTFGMGRYILESAQGDITLPRVLPVRPLWDEVIIQDNLDNALLHNRQDPYSNEDSEHNRLHEIITQIEQDRYSIPTLKGYTRDKKDGGLRLLMVPPFWDRVMQRAFAQVLSSKLEDIMYRQSYGYRPGRSRLNAKDAIQLAYREGYHWVFESDIKDFFSQLDISRLMVRLQGLFYDDPALVWIEQWMCASLEYEDKLYQRTQGVPQGSPLSPILANLFLDDFDNDMRLLGLRLVRFADDFVILCKTQEQAQQVGKNVQSSLEEHGMVLNPEKTRISPLDQGFHFLGYVFINDMVLEAAPLNKDKKQTLSLAIAEKLALNEATPLNDFISEKYSKNKQTIQLVASAQENNYGSLLCVQGHGKWLSIRQGRVCVYKKEEKLADLAWSQIQAIVLIGNHQLSSQVIKASLKESIPIYFLKQNGSYEGCTWNQQPQHSGPAFWLRQQEVFLQKENALQAGKQIVRSRIMSQWEVLRQRQTEEIAVHIKDLRRYLEKTEAAESLSQLNGYEGIAARHYFLALAQLLPDEFGFNQRNRRPPKDPVNVLLSLGYTILYNYVDSLLRINGFYPWTGLYHQPRGGYSPLAADLMEPFRFLVERTVLSAILLKKIKVNDFFIAQDGSCRITDKARNDYLSDLINKFDARLKGRHDLQACNLIEHLNRQNQRLIEWLRDERELQIWSLR